MHRNGWVLPKVAIGILSALMIGLAGAEAQATMYPCPWDGAMHLAECTEFQPQENCQARCEAFNGPGSLGECTEPIPGAPWGCCTCRT